MAASIMPWLRRSFGGSLQGRTVLDLGCNTGGMALAAATEGAEVTAIDAREEHITLARQRASSNGRSNVRFIAADVTKLDEVLDEADRFDVVLVLGLLYHLDDPLRFMRNLAPRVAGIIVIDSHVHYDADAQREAVPSWWMLPDSDWATAEGMLPNDPRGSAASIAAREQALEVPYDAFVGNFSPPPHLRRELEVADVLDGVDHGPIAEGLTSWPPGRLVLIPNRAAIRDLFRASGFSHVCEIVPPRFAPRPYLLRYRATLLAFSDAPGTASVSRVSD